jgi:RNA polymerase sigma-70 factor, ECF subfamily
MLKDGAEAEDVAQETFARLCNADLASNDAPTLVAWIYRTATHLGIDRLRRARPEGADDVEPQAPALDEQVEMRRWLARIARRAPPGELELVTMARIDGMTHREIAITTGKSERTVRRLLARFDKRMAAWTVER